MHFLNIKTFLKGYGLESMKQAVIAAGAILYYLNETEHKETGHILSISRIAEEKYVWLDKFTIRNLELIYSQADNGIPLISIMDHTVTPMGGRMMKKWMVLPLKLKHQIILNVWSVSSFNWSSSIIARCKFT